MKKFYITIGSIWAVIVLMLVGRAAITGAASLKTAEERTNTECLSEQRVFDYADVLTDKQEKKLEKLIAKREKQVGIDIAVVTICEDVGSDYYNIRTKEFAEDFYTYYKFGWDKPVGDGALFVDNWYETQWGAESWFTTSGRVTDFYTDSMVNTIIDRVLEYDNVSPYYAYKLWVNTVAMDMCSLNILNLYLSDKVILIIAVVITGIFVLCNAKAKRGKKTTHMDTYVNSGDMNMHVQEDQFLSKSVTKTKIQSSSGGGHGGGGHRGGGGFGGGGGRH